jgi:hypothetical protein
MWTGIGVLSPSKTRLGMSNPDDWIVSRTAEARERHPVVTDAAFARMTRLLKGQLSEGQSTLTELASAARDLIADMTPVPPNGSAKQ